MIKLVEKMERSYGEFQERNFYFRYMRASSRARQWGMYVTTCGRSTVSPNCSYPPVQHPAHHHFDWEHGRVLDEYQIVYVDEGHGVFETDHSHGRVESGMAIVLRQGMWHRYRPKIETGWREYWVGFAGPGFNKIFNAGFFADREIFRVSKEIRMRGLFEELIGAAQENGPALQQTLAAQANLILAHVYASTMQHRPGTAKSATCMVQRACEMMQAPDTCMLSLEETARRLGTSYSSFRRTFREHTGSSPHQYRLRLKMSLARDLLLNTRLSVKEIAFRSGFEEEQYFCRFFRKTMGRTPSSFRDR